MSYNKIISLKEAVFTDEKAIGIQLDERNKLFDSLINSVKKYMEHEKGVFADIVRLRNQAKQTSASSSNGISQEDEEQLSQIVSSGALSSGINMTMEAYPDLKSSNNMMQLQEAIESIERKLANSKKAFNMSIEDYNGTVQSIPALFVVKMFPKQLKYDFKRWALSKENIKTAEERVVEF
jgi:LemA protein